MKNNILKIMLIAVFIIILIIIFFMITYIFIVKNNKQINEKNEQTLEVSANIQTSEDTNIKNNENTSIENSRNEQDNQNIENKKIDDWKIILVNNENPLPEDYQIELENIDKTRKFDKRAIGELNNMILAMRNSGISNIWVQSAYRTIEYQQQLYNNSINKYLRQGKNQEEAKVLTENQLAKPGQSEHNLGLAVDFNYVDESFEKTRAFAWLKENAQNYGFILRYPKEKENITKILYEPWHWRYVGQEHAKKIKELGMCLEEYINSEY